MCHKDHQTTKKESNGSKHGIGLKKDGQKKQKKAPQHAHTLPPLTIWSIGMFQYFKHGVHGGIEQPSLLSMKIESKENQKQRKRNQKSS
jgi:hypothetical protein